MELSKIRQRWCQLSQVDRLRLNNHIVPGFNFVEGKTGLFPLFKAQFETLKDLPIFWRTFYSVKWTALFVRLKYEYIRNGKSERA